MENSFLLTLTMFLLILCIGAAIPLFIFGRIFHKKPLWITGVVLFGMPILTMIVMIAVREFIVK